MTRDGPDPGARGHSAVERRLVLVVHGIGDDAPGEAVRRLSGTLAAVAGRSPDRTPELVWFPTAHGRQIRESPCHLERCRTAERETILAEVYWADLSRLRRGLLGTLRGLNQLVFGLRHLVHRAADPTRPGRQGDARFAAMMQRLCARVDYLLRGPVAAQALLGTLWMFVFLGIQVVVADSGTKLAPVVAMGLVGLFIGYRGLRRPRGSPARLFSFWLVLIGLAYLGVAGLARWQRDSDWLWELLWLARVALGHASAADPYYMGHLGALGLIATWTIVYALLLVAAVVWLLARSLDERRYRPGLDAAYAVTVLNTTVWLMALSVLWATAFSQLPEVFKAREHAELLRFALPAVGLLWLYIALVALVAFVTWACRRYRAGCMTAEGHGRERPCPRLLIGNRIRDTVIWANVLIASRAMTVVDASLRRGQQDLLERANFLAIQAAVLIGLGAITLREGLRFGLDLGLDVIGHFRPESPAAGETPRFPQRAEIEARLRTVLRELVAREAPGRVTIVAHSQGTIAAIDVLAQAGTQGLPDPWPRCDLVTLGSPFRHLYQHYFPNDYPPLADSRWDALRARVDRWINIFRVDDFVGTEIEPDGDWPVNVPVDPAGHLGYWNDRRVVEELLERRLA